MCVLLEANLRLRLLVSVMFWDFAMSYLPLSHQWYEFWIVLISISHRCWKRVAGVSVGKLLQHPNLRHMADPATWVRAWPRIWSNQTPVVKLRFLMGFIQKKSTWSINHHKSNELVLRQQQHRCARSTCLWSSNASGPVWLGPWPKCVGCKEGQVLGSCGLPHVSHTVSYWT